MSTPRQIIVLLPPADSCDSPDALLQAAAAMVQGSTLKVLAIGSALHAPMQSRALPAPAQWYEMTHANLTRIDAEQLLPICLEAVEQAGAADHALLLTPPGPITEECAVRMATQLGGTYLGRCAQLTVDDADVVATRAGYGGRVGMQLASSSGFCAASWRPANVKSHATPSAASHMPQIIRCTLTTQLPSLPQSTPIESTDKIAPLENARLVVGGGRGMQGDEGFALLTQIAQRLGASLGGSLPTVDAGWVPVARQIGQSGKFVNPRVYFTVGISGTPQHLAGVSTDSRIIAVNKDREAPIFSRAEVGVVAQWQDLLPQLLQELQNTSA
ncbi:MAG: electron transfer flavoprotein subunit alpha/FixB family protein [Proteobacteria bacterium]|nr:electron transfer flavoprotein subunit alpha/FixB family protein [Pseudomonadota bacterium]